MKRFFTALAHRLFYRTFTWPGYYQEAYVYTPPRKKRRMVVVRLVDHTKAEVVCKVLDRARALRDSGAPKGQIVSFSPCVPYLLKCCAPFWALPLWNRISPLTHEPINSFNSFVEGI